MKLENRERILVADDDQSIRQLLGTIIKRERLEVDLAPDGAEAIEHLKRREYSVILLDLMMPRVDGFGVIQYLRDHPQTHKPVVIVITAYADQRLRRSTRRSSRLSCGSPSTSPTSEVWCVTASAASRPRFSKRTPRATKR
jgi:CheY-like chemotaxis protein